MRFIRSMLAASAAMLAVSVAVAQSGGIEVRVTDENGAPLPGATVTIGNDQGRVKTTAQLTDKTGIASFPVLYPGDGYWVQIEFPGMSPRREAGLHVKIGEVQKIPVQMIEKIEERVKVVADKEVISLETVEQTTKFSANFISDLPVPGRFYQNVLTLAPGVNDADGDGNPNVHGSRDRDFSMSVSGVRNVDPLTGQFMSRVNPNSIEEMEVITAGAGVEFGRAQGGFGRIIQKQGSNEHEGVFEYYYRTSKLDGTGAHDFNKIFDPNFDWNQPAIQLSGPVVRDKLWYRLSHEYRKIGEPIDVVSGIVVRERNEWTHADQLTWQVSPRNKLALQYQSDPTSISNVNINNNVGPDAALGFKRKGETYSLTWTAPYSPKILVDSTVAWQDTRVSLFPNTTGVTNGCVGGSPFLENAQCRDLRTGRVTGSFFRTQEDHSQRFTANGQATLFGGRFWGMNHIFKVGVNVENERYFRHLERRPNIAFFIVNTPQDNPDQTTGGNNNPQSFGIAFARVSVPQEDDVRATGTNWALYGQDEFKPAPNLTITAGGRIDRVELNSEGHTPVDGATEFGSFTAALATDPSVSTRPEDFFAGYEGLPSFKKQMIDILCPPGTPDLGACQTDANQNILSPPSQEQLTVRRAQDLTITNTDFSPFLSFAWSPWSNGKTAIKGSVRRYYNPVVLLIPLQELEPAFVDIEYRTDLSDNSTTLLGGIRPSAVSVSTVNPDMNTPYQDEFTLAIERELWAETSISLRYINRRYRQQIQDENVNLNTGDFGHCKFQTGAPTTDDPHPWILASPGRSQHFALPADGPGGDPYWIADSTGGYYGADWIMDPFTGAHYPDIEPGVGDGYGPGDDCSGKSESFNPKGTAVGGGENTVTLRRPDGITDLYLQNPYWADIFLIGNINRIDYESFIVELVRRQYRSWEMQSSYTWSKAIGDGEDFFQELGDDPSLKGNVSGHQSYDVTHVLKWAATTITPWGVRLGTTIQWQSGLPYSILLAERSVDTPPPVEDLPYNPVSRQRQVYSTGERNDQRNASVWNIDLRATREFNLGKGLNVQLSAEIYNLLNDAPYTIYDPTQFVQRGEQVNGVNTAFYRNTVAGNFGRQWQLGLKLSF